MNRAPWSSRQVVGESLSRIPEAPDVKHVNSISRLREVKITQDYFAQSSAGASCWIMFGPAFRHGGAGR